MVKHQFVNDESNASWSKYMYTYLRNIGSLFFMEFSFFSKVWVSDSKLWWLFLFLLTRVISCDLDLWKGYDISILLFLQPLSERLSALSNIFCFLRKRINKPTLLCVCWITPQLDHAPKCSIWVFLRDKAMWKKIWLFIESYFHGEFLKFQSYSKYINHIDIGLKQTCSEEIQVIFMVRVFISVENFCFAFGEKVKWYFIDQSGLSFNLKVS
jgi:hypothetical protein